MTMANNVNESLANLVATIESVAAGGSNNCDDDHDTEMITADMLEGTVLHLSNGQSINVVQMTGSIEDTINVVQVETTELGDHDHVSTIEEICGIDIDSEEQNHILSETGAHVVVNTESEVIGNQQMGQGDFDSGDKPLVLPTIPFSFPGQTFECKCQKLILNVWDFFKRLKKNPDILDEIRTPQERAAAALHISAATIGKIGKKFKRTGKLETPGRKRKRAKPVVDSVDTDQEQIIRIIIKEFKDNRVTPTLPLLLAECRERINFQGGATSFRRILQRMGYKGLTAKMNSNNVTSTSKLKPVTTSVTSTQSPKKVTTQSPSITKTMSMDHGFLSIPVTTPVSSPPATSNKIAFRAVMPSKSCSLPPAIKTEPTFSTANISSRMLANLFGGNILQLGTSGNGEPITISQQTASAIASATSRVGEGPQTIHVLQADNTLQQIQIVYANMSS